MGGLVSERGVSGEVAHRHQLRRMTPNWAALQPADRRPQQDPLYGLSSDVAVAVLTLGTGQSQLSPDVAVAVLLDVHDKVAWPQDPPRLPPAPRLDLPPEQQQEVAADEELVARLVNEEQLVAEGYNDADLAPLHDADRRRRAAALRPDMLAFYRPFTQLTGEQAFDELMHNRRTGIFITTGGVEQLAADAFVAAGLSDELSLLCAFALLYGHEYGHFLADVAHAACDLKADPIGSEDQSAAHRAHHHDASCPVEEAICEAYALEFLADVLRHRYGIAAEDIGRALEAARRHVADGLPGYRDGASATTTRQTFDLLTEALGHTDAEQAREHALLADLDRRTAQTGDVPLHLVVTPGSAFEAGCWGLIGVNRPDQT